MARVQSAADRLYVRFIHSHYLTGCLKTFELETLEVIFERPNMFLREIHQARECDSECFAYLLCETSTK